MEDDWRKHSCSKRDLVALAATCPQIAAPYSAALPGQQLLFSPSTWPKLVKQLVLGNTEQACRGILWYAIMPKRCVGLAVPSPEQKGAQLQEMFPHGYTPSLTSPQRVVALGIHSKEGLS